MNMTKCALLLAALVVSTGCEQKPTGLPNVDQQGNVVVRSSPSSPAMATQSKQEVVMDDNIVIPNNAAVAVTKNFYFVIDGSGSMDTNLSSRQEYQKFGTRMKGAKHAVAEAFRLVPDDANVALYAFDRQGSSQRVALSNKLRSGFISAVSSISSGGGTPLAASIKQGVDSLVKQREKQLGYGEYRLIVVTDGEADYVPNAIAYANQNDIPVYGIGLEVGVSHPLRQGTIYSDASSIAELQAALKETLGEISSLDGSDLFK